jgi:hypothetical protein
MLRILTIIIGLLTVFTTTSYSQYVWKRYCDLKSSRQFFNAFDIGNNEILVVGGYINSVNIGTGYVTRSCEIINTVNGTSVYTDSMASAKAEFVALLTPDSNVVAVSGLSQQSGGLTSQVELYNRTTKKWSVIGNLQVARRQHGACFISSTEILVVGGRLANSTTIATAEIFNITTGVSRFVQDYPIEITTLNLARMQNGTIVGFTGRTGGSNSFRPSEIYRYITATNTWLKLTDIPAGVNGTSFTNTWDGRLFINGGALTDAPTTNARWTYIEGSNGTFSRLGDMQDDRRWHQTTQLTLDTLLISGGFDGSQLLPRRSVEWVNMQTGQVTSGPNHIVPHGWHQLVSVPITKNSQGVPTRAKLFAISGMMTQNAATSLVEVLDICSVEPTITSNRSSICQGDTTLIDAGQGYTGYRWNTGAQTRTIIAQDGGAYWVEVTDVNGCSGRDTVILRVNPRPKISIEVLPNDTVCRSTTGSLGVSGGGMGATYNWTPSVGLNSTTVANPQFSIAFAGTYTYTVTVTDNLGCSATAQTKITIKSCNTAVSMTSDRNVQLPFNSCDSLLSVVSLTNDGDVSVTIDSLSPVGGVQQGATLDDVFARQIKPQFFPMILPPNTSRVVPIRIVPTGTGDYSTDIVAYYDGTMRKTLTIAGKTVRRSLTMKVLGTQAQFKKDFALPVYVESQYWDELKINDIMLTILYDNKSLEFVGGSAVSISSALNTTWRATVVADSVQSGKLTLRLQSTQPSIYLTKNDTVALIGFRPVLRDSLVVTTEPSLRFSLPSKRIDCTQNLTQSSVITISTLSSVDVEDREPGVLKGLSPSEIRMSPNPASTRLAVECEVYTEDFIELKLYDILGRTVSVLYSGTHRSGILQTVVDVSSLAEGVYYCTLTSAGNTFTKQLRIVR